MDTHLQAIEAARCDEEYQIERWGVVEGGHDVDRANVQVNISGVATYLHLLAGAGAGIGGGAAAEAAGWLPHT